MALTKFGNIIVDMRGSINGNTYSQNKYGSIVRTKKTPINPKSSFQNYVRSLFALLSQAWSALAQSDRDQWNAAAPNFARTSIFGDNAPLTGFNFWMRINGNLNAIGQPQLTAPPINTSVEGSLLTSVDCDTTGGAMTIAFSATPTAADIYHQVFATAPKSQGKAVDNSGFRQIGVINPATATGASIKAMYENKFGALPAAGQKVFVKLIPTDSNTGLTGQETTQATIAV